MLFYENLSKIIFTRNQLVKCDELLIISGYVGPTPIHQLENLPIPSTVVYGMYGAEGIQKSIHESLLKEQEELSKVSILYSTIPIHAKCYIWKQRGEVESALIGSANFSTNGLNTPFKEVLADATVDTFSPLKVYSNKILNSSIPCYKAQYKENKKKKITTLEKAKIYDPEVCSIPLYLVNEFGKPYIPERSGLNWGMAKLSGSHVNISDAYLSISAEIVEHYPQLFPQKQDNPKNMSNIARRNHRHNDSIEIIWDDGTIMTGLLEGSRAKLINGSRVLFPKQIATTPSKALLGTYLRKRLQIPIGEPITYGDLVRYGRNSIDISLQGEGVYYFDFSTHK